MELAADAGPVTVVGDGAVRYRQLLSVHPQLDLGRAAELSAPPPLALARPGPARLARRRGLRSAAADLVPDYRRPADARINWEQRAPPAGTAATPGRPTDRGPVTALPTGTTAPVPVVIAPMRTKDLQGVLRIEEAVFPQPWSHRLFVEELAQRTSRAYRAAWVGRVHRRASPARCSSTTSPM